MKKALILFASPHKDGYTKRLMDSFLSGLSQEKWETEIFNIYETAVQPCRACGACKKIDGCIYHDLDGFDASFRACDLLVIASPVYNLSFPAQLKSVIDRFQRYFETRFARGERTPIKKTRKAVLLLTMGQHDPFAAEVCEKMLKQSFSVMNTKLIYTCCLADTDKGIATAGAVFEKAHIKAIEIGNEL